MGRMGEVVVKLCMVERLIERLGEVNIGVEGMCVVENVW